MAFGRGAKRGVAEAGRETVGVDVASPEMTLTDGRKHR